MTLSPEAAELIVTAQEATVSTQEAVNELVRALERHNRPAQMRPIALTTGTPKWRDEAGDTALSIGFYNPSGATIYTNLAGDIAEPGRDALPVPPRSLLVLPISATDVELGADPAELTGDDARIVVYVLRFDTVQPAFLASFPAAAP